MNETKRKNAVLVIAGILLLGALVLSTGVASAENSNLSEQITAEELFELLSGNWSFNGTMTIGEQAIPTIGTRTVSLTGPTTADFVVVMAGEEGAETGEAWWDADKEKFAIKEGDEEPRYYDLLPNGYGSTYELDGLPELGIMENVTCEERETFVDDNTTVKTWTAKNITGIVVAKWESTFTRIKEAPVEEYERIGILVIGHGSPSDSWCAPVRSVVANVSLPYPVELGFLEFVPNETINIAVDKLDEAGVTKIIAVPLFISSHSGHISEIEYVLGLREELPMMSMQVLVEGKELERSIVALEGRYRVSYTPIVETVSAMGVTAKQHHGGGEAEEEELVPVDTPAEIVLTNAIDDHWAIADILVDHAAALSKDPANETIVLVAHGTGNESNFAGWVSSSESLAEQMRLKLRYGMGLNIKDVRYSFVFPNETLHSDLLVRAVVENVSATSDTIVVPLMVSEGHFTGRKIPKLLENLSYAYLEKGERALTPHPNVAEWIELSAAKELSYPSVQIYDGEELLTITIEDAGKYHGEGVIEICPCVASAFRSTLRAFSEAELWNGTPHRGDVKINSGHPSDGHMMTFEYILGSTSTEDLTVDEGADIVNITADNYVYSFTRKSTNDSITLRVKEEIFPERFFELRTKCKLAKMGKGDVTIEEKKAFTLLWGELKEKLMYKPMDSVFEESS
ncbi:hypothetical protein C5S29_03715 [ANME-1 cluster archaeon GoMg3.2]|nr:hypothetical protein [ANME-1 cluster archaeon GoMg3.2]